MQANGQFSAELWKNLYINRKIQIDDEIAHRFQSLQGRRAEDAPKPSLDPANVTDDFHRTPARAPDAVSTDPNSRDTLPRSSSTADLFGPIRVRQRKKKRAPSPYPSPPSSLARKSRSATSPDKTPDSSISLRTRGYLRPNHRTAKATNGSTERCTRDKTPVRLPEPPTKEPAVPINLQKSPYHKSAYLFTAEDDKYITDYFAWELSQDSDQHRARIWEKMAQKVCIAHPLLH